jgi:hypothetical protein
MNESQHSNFFENGSNRLDPNRWSMQKLTEFGIVIKFPSPSQFSSQTKYLISIEYSPPTTFF